MKTLYTARATASGREGRAVSEDGFIDLPLTAPREAGGSGEGTNPEALFAAGYAACFAGAVGVVGRRMKLDVDGVSVSAEVDLRAEDDRGFGIAARLHVHVPDSLSDEEADRLVEAAHQVCPYSRATRGNIPVAVHAERRTAA